MKHFCQVLEWSLLGDVGARKWPDKGFVQLQKNCTTAIKFHNCKKDEQLLFHFTTAKNLRKNNRIKMHNCYFISQLQKNGQLKNKCTTEKQMYNCETYRLQYLCGGTYGIFYVGNHNTSVILLEGNPPKPGNPYCGPTDHWPSTDQLTAEEL